MARLVRTVRRLQRVAGHPEFKYIDTPVVNSDMDDTGYVTPITLIAQGDTAGTRDGDRVRLQSLLVRWQASIVGAGAPTAQMRFWIIEDKRPNGTVISDPSVPFEGTISTLSFNDLEKAGRFKVWRDVSRNLDADGSNANINGHFYIKFKKPRLQIYDTASANTPTAGSAFYLVQVSDQPNTGTGLSTAFNIRFRYTDN